MHDAVVYFCGFFLGFWLASFPCFTDPIGRILDYITVDAIVIHGAADVARNRPVVRVRHDVKPVAPLVGLKTTAEAYELRKRRCSLQSPRGVEIDVLPESG